ncbi:MAG: TM2 domain-containing protein, partial [Butyricicoccaceae bacterium]
MTKTSPKRRKTALLLCTFLGWLGVHRFYLGKIRTGLLYTLGFTAMLTAWIFDIVRIASGSITDCSGRALR